MTVTRSREQKFDEHRLWFEEPDTLAFEVHGDLTEAQARAIMAEQGVIARDRHYLLLLIDMRQFTTVSPEARRVFAQDAGVMPPLVSVYFGASFAARVMAELLYGIANLIGRQRHRYRFCDDEAAARAYIAEIRPSYMGAT